MTSRTDEVYQAIYEDIMKGTLYPDQKLHIAQLAEKFDVQVSPAGSLIQVNSDESRHCHEPTGL